MRSRVLELLKKYQPDFVSGETIARELSVSRTAVWKAIHYWQDKDYLIESSPRLGYRLLQAPGWLYPVEMEGKLQSKLIGMPVEKMHHFLSLESTNETLKQLAEKGASEGTVVLAEEQTRGKGRLGRSWSSPRGKGIWLSVLLKPAVFPQEVPVFTLLAALAVSRAIRMNHPELKAGIKWPNDILVHEKKACGILTELKAETDRIHYLVAGIGLNADQEEEDFPPDLAPSATSIYLESGKKADRLQLAADMINQLDHAYHQFCSQGARPIIKAWKEHSITLGRKVTISHPAGDYPGKAVDISADGALVVEKEDGTRKHFHAGEVTLRR